MNEARIKCLRCGNDDVQVSRHKGGEQYLFFGCNDKKAVLPETTIAINLAICADCGEVAFLQSKESRKSLT